LVRIFVKGSYERKKARKVVAHIYQRIANKRHDFIHQQARKIVDKYRQRYRKKKIRGVN